VLVYRRGSAAADRHSHYGRTDEQCDDHAPTFSRLRFLALDSILLSSEIIHIQACYCDQFPVTVTMLVGSNSGDIIEIVARIEPVFPSALRTMLVRLLVAP
jgi:hypothetical protein